MRQCGAQKKETGMGNLRPGSMPQAFLNANSSIIQLIYLKNKQNQSSFPSHGVKYLLFFYKNGATNAIR